MRTMGVAPSSFACLALVTTRAAAPSFTPGALPAVTVPSFLKAGFSAAQDFDRGVFARRFVFVEDDRGCALFLGGQFNRDNLRFESTLFDGGDGLAVRVHSELVLLFASDAVFFGDVLAGDAHVVVVVDVP